MNIEQPQSDLTTITESTSAEIQNEQDLYVEEPIHDENEYDPSNPSPSHGQAIPIKENMNDISSTNTIDSQKRKLSDTIASNTEANRVTKAPKLEAMGSQNIATPEHTSELYSKPPQKVDRKGLSEASWDSLMNLQSCGDFHTAQVSRAAYLRIAELPEFAQFVIIAKFARTDMKDTRDKNGLLMRLYENYCSENPQINSLRSVVQYGQDCNIDEELFHYGYAPPIPSTGMSVNPVPFIKKMDNGTTSTGEGQPQSEGNSMVDEFGRSIPISATGTKVTDSPNKGSRYKDHLAMEKNSDPVKLPQSNHSAQKTFGQIPSIDYPPDQGLVGESMMNSPLYDQLPRSVRTGLESMLSSQRLKEPFNDNVISRLLSLPEDIAIEAIGNFNGVDPSTIDNPNGFLVGIINRLNSGKSLSGFNKANRNSSPVQLGGRRLNSHDPRVNSRSGYNADRDYAYGPQQDTYQYEPLLDYPNAGTQYGLPTAPINIAPGHLSPRVSRSTLMDTFMPDQTPIPHDNQYFPVSHPYNDRENSGSESKHAVADAIAALPVSVQQRLHAMAAAGTITSVDEFSEKCYEVLGQLSEGLANEVLKRFTHANLSAVRNRSGFLIGVVKRCRQEYNFHG